MAPQDGSMLEAKMDPKSIKKSMQKNMMFGGWLTYGTEKKSEKKRSHGYDFYLVYTRLRAPRSRQQDKKFDAPSKNRKVSEPRGPRAPLPQSQHTSPGVPASPLGLLNASTGSCGPALQGLCQGCGNTVDVEGATQRRRLAKKSHE